MLGAKREVVLSILQILVIRCPSGQAAGYHAIGTAFDSPHSESIPEETTSPSTEKEKEKELPRLPQDNMYLGLQATKAHRLRDMRTCKKTLQT